MIALICTKRQFGPNLNISIYKLSIKNAFEYSFVNFKNKNILFKSCFKILSLFALSNNMRFGALDFVEGGNLTNCNWNSIISKIKCKNILFQLYI